MLELSIPRCVYTRHLLMYLCLSEYYHSDRYLLETSASPRLNNTIVRYTRVWFVKLAKIQREDSNVLI